MKRHRPGNNHLALPEIILGIATLIGSSALFGWALHARLYPLMLITLPLIPLSIWRLIAAYRDSIRRVTFMLNAIENDDFTIRFYEKEQQTDNRLLNITLNRIRNIMFATKLRIEERERYYELIMECARTGLVILNDAGSVYQANDEALRLLGLPRMTHIIQLRSLAPELCRTLDGIREGDRRHVTIVNETGEMHLSLSCSEVTLDKRRLRIISMSDINAELQEKEAESWSKLTRILTHEIMNSLAPITSLSDTLLQLEPNPDSDMAHGLDTISTTGKRLLQFVDSFRRFTRIPAPQKMPLELRSLVGQAVLLTGAHGTPRIEVRIDPDDTMIYADEGLVSQVLVNLLKNAREAVGDRPDGLIGIASRIDAQENVVVEVSDNGPAIPPEAVEHIFTPFFTTKEEGSGIGLSVSRRIMQLHEGSLRLTSNREGRVTFTLLFG